MINGLTLEFSAVQYEIIRVEDLFHSERRQNDYV